MYTQLFHSLTPHDLIVTVNRRLTAYLRERYANFQQQQSKNIWFTPKILPINTWLENCWEESLDTNHEHLRLLSNAQEQFLWGQILENTTTQRFIQRSATIKKAQQAWQLCRQWQVPYTQSTFAHAENTHAWQQWALEFATTCKKNHWLDAATLTDWLIAHYFDGVQNLPPKIYLVGFDEINPQYERLFRKLRSLKIDIINIDYQQPSLNVKRLALTDPNSELQTMAQWAYQLWQQGEQAIGCVVPNLTELRSAVLSTFMEVFAPEAFLPGYHEQALPFNISAGQSLKNFPLINLALQILNLNDVVAYTEISSLIRSPYLGYAEEELTLRCRLDQQLCSLESLLTLQQIIVSSKKTGANKLAQLLQNFLQIKQIHNNQQLSTQEWTIVFSRLLSACGWPGERSLNSTEYQLIESWSNLLTTFAQLEQVCPTLNYQQALQQLTHLVNAQEFQAQSAPKPIQILGILESAGVEFSHLWIMGLDDNTWPTSATPNPFIPLKLQRQLHMPHSSSQRELEYCRQLTQRLTHSAPQVIVSYPQGEEDRVLRPSPLITNFTALNIASPSCLSPTEEEGTCYLFSANSKNSYKKFAELIFASRDVELLTDETAPALNEKEKEKLTGGATLLKDQAACPFRAFARFRLGAFPLETPQMGLTYQQRGTLLHQALEIVWQKITSQQNLCQLEETELDIIIHQAIDLALLNFIKKRPLTLRQRYIHIEKKRLTRLLNDWLELEKKRAPFTVFSMEKSIKYNLGGISLVLRSDRIDQLADNHYLIIDYKTGLISEPDWLSDRPKEPQLPLYCITSELPITGIALAQVRADKKLFRGISAKDDTGIPGINSLQQQKEEDKPESWNDLILHWQRVLLTLGTQFHQGHAPVDPVDGHKTCQFCDLQTLCRVQAG